ncbi:MAG: hypothetical protein H0X51_09220 [Parachlamydiaceae bacterium]|nr:hypothetical protein [Parachlamydiaceae bacterium]
MNLYTIALFGESEKGVFQMGYFLQTLPQLLEQLGNPPPNSRGLYYATQALLYHRDLLFFRVREEGFSYEDYLAGLQTLEKQSFMETITAVCLPGVGDLKIIHAMIPFCQTHHSILITNEADLYDYITA